MSNSYVLWIPANNVPEMFSGKFGNNLPELILNIAKNVNIVRLHSSRISKAYKVL